MTERQIKRQQERQETEQEGKTERRDKTVTERQRYCKAAR